MSDQPNGRPRSASITFDLGGRSVSLQIQVPAGDVPPSRLLPLVHSLTDLAVDASVQDLAEPVSCTAGCGACCRQLAPLSETEARAIHALVDAMPAERRDAVKARFAAALEGLEKAGLLEPLRGFSRLPGPERSALGLAYFRQGLPCPFLEDESCSIHAERPVICREFLVTSDARHCAEPSPQTVRRVTLDARISRGLAALDAPPAEKRPPNWIPLTLALAWTEAQPPEPVRGGEQLLQDFFSRLSARDLSGHPGADEA
ncbi:MAG TPA: YkgJ family cysteine cluster protein [Burkholderiaceae bacterium]|nr:YkgJ family cysteine cluster protein [Burkholderiaceae bacterium]